MIGDVVDEEEGVGAQVGGRPEAAVFFLTGRVGEGEEVGFPIDIASDRIRVLYMGVVGVRGEEDGLEGKRGGRGTLLGYLL